MFLLQEHKHASDVCFRFFFIGSFVASTDLQSDYFAAFYGYQVMLYIPDAYLRSCSGHAYRLVTSFVFNKRYLDFSKGFMRVRFIFRYSSSGGNVNAFQ